MYFEWRVDNLKLLFVWTDLTNRWCIIGLSIRIQGYCWYIQCPCWTFLTFLLLFNFCQQVCSCLFNELVTSKLGQLYVLKHASIEQDNFKKGLGWWDEFKKRVQYSELIALFGKQFTILQFSIATEASLLPLNESNLALVSFFFFFRFQV